jgi:hypothetical protein
VTYERDGFKMLVRDGITVDAGVSRTVDASLEIGGISEVVTISGGAELVTTTTASTFKQLSAEELTKVPTATRSFTHLLSAEAGVTADLPPVSTNGNGNLSPSVNGTRTTSTSLQFNGIDATNFTTNEGSLNNNISPAPETLEEVKLQTSLYDASTGRSGGGNFQLVTKSGTNEVHGSAYYYLQNEKLNANDFFFNRDGIERPRARRNEGGFTIGGPVIKDKLFLFGGYQRTQASTAFVPTASSQTVLPQALRDAGGRSAAELFAAFSNPRNNANPAAFLASIPNAAAISPLAVRLFQLRNPETGDFIIPAPRAGAEAVGMDPNVAGGNGGNRLLRQRNVFPADFTQDQFTIRTDYQINAANRLSGTVFFAKFPGFDPFPDPSSLASPFTLRRDDRNITFAISDVHVFSPTFINEGRFGMFELRNNRGLDEPFLSITNDSVGIPNPATLFDASPGTLRLARFVGRNQISNFSFGGPNDSFNRRFQRTFNLADTVTLIRGNHTFRFGGEYKRHRFDTNLPEEQAIEFERFDNFTQILRGLGTEADTQFGITDKAFRFNDISFFFTDDWKVNRRLTINAGIRYDIFTRPTEEDGRIGNFDPSLVTDTENPLSGFIIPSNTRDTAFPAINGAIAVTQRVDNKHTFNGQDLNNVGPRIGFAYSPFDSNKLVIRGGYGIFFDRPSAAFINTLFSNYPFLREIEVTAPNTAVPLATAFSQQNPNLPFNQFLPARVVRTGGANGTYQIRDNTGVTLQANGTPNPIDPATGRPFLGNVAETFEFRAVDRDTATPYIQQFNLGVQYELTKNIVVEARYVGTKGTKLLQALILNPAFDLNDPRTPDHVFARFNNAYTASGSPLGVLPTTGTQRERGIGRAFGFANPALGGRIDLNLANPAGQVIGFESRGGVLGLNIPEAILLTSSGSSIYHSLQLITTQRLSRGLQYSLAYTYSKSIDDSSTDPGSTAGGGRPDVPNAGFVVQGDPRNLRLNRGPSDFDRTNRFSASFVYDLPSFGLKSRFLTGFSFSGFVQIQSGAPFSIFSSEPELQTAAQSTDIARGSGGLFRPGFGRPNLAPGMTIEDLRRASGDMSFNPAAITSSLGQFGNLGRNVLRGDRQKRVDFGIAKLTPLTERVTLEFRGDIFNAFNNVNFALPNNDLQDGTDFGRVTNTVGGPRIAQFSLKLRF